MSTLAALLIGVAIGLFLPAPYDGIARSVYRNIYTTVTGWFGGSK